MSTPQVPAPDKPALAGYLDALARSSATLLLVMYGAGFVILAAYEARYGIAQFGPLRARIFLVGFAFVALSALPIAAHHYGFANYGPIKTIRENKEPAVQRERGLVLVCGFAITAYWMALAFNLLLFIEEAPKRDEHFWVRQASFAAAWFALFWIYEWIAKRLTEHPKQSAILASVTSVVFMGLLTWSAPETISGLTCWFWVAATAGSSIRSSPNRVSFLLDFRNWLWIILSISIYVSSIMGHMQQKFGGGAPVPAVIYLNKPLAFTGGNTTIEVALLDETEQGYYVLPRDKHKALFIPRGEVTSIYFGPAEDSPKLP
jgi:hypothetical protein